MNHQDFVAAVAKEADITLAEAKAGVDTTLDMIRTALRRGEEVKLHNFGVFKAAKREARTGRNPATGEALKIAAKTVPTFSAAKHFKEFVNTRPAIKRERRG